MHAPSGARLVWGECRGSVDGATGLHTYPDLDLVQLVDPETLAAAAGGEVVLTQLGLRGSALLRWRTGDTASTVVTTDCPRCGRRVPRLIGTGRAALVPVLSLRGRPPRGVDLRAMSGVLDGTAEVADWRMLIRHNRAGAEQLVVQVSAVEPADDATVLVTQVARALRDASGVLPSQLGVVEPARLARPDGSGPSRRVLDRRPGGSQAPG